MGVGKIIQLVGVLVALVAGVIGGEAGVESAFAFAAVLVALLGLAGGWFIEKDDRMRFLVATIALLAVSGALGVIPEVGGYISGALGGLAALFSAAAVTVIVVGTVEAVRP